MKQRSERSWSVALLYLVSAGLLGGHRLYLGRRRSAAFQAALFVIPMCAITLVFVPPLFAHIYQAKEILLLMLLASLGWLFFDLITLAFGPFVDDQKHEVSPIAGEWKLVWKSLILGVVLLGAQLLVVWACFGSLRPAWQNLVGPPLVRSVLWVWCTLAFSYIATYFWDQWFGVKEAGILFLIQPLFFAFWSFLVVAVDLSVTISYWGKHPHTIDAWGRGLARKYSMVLHHLLMALGFALFCGALMLVAYTAALLRKTELQKSQSKPGWLLLGGFVVVLLAGRQLWVFGGVVAFLLSVTAVAQMAPPFRQELEHYSHSQIRPVLSFSLLCGFVFAVAVAFEYFVFLTHEYSFELRWAAKGSSRAAPASRLLYNKAFLQALARKSRSIGLCLKTPGAPR